MRLLFYILSTFLLISCNNETKTFEKAISMAFPEINNSCIDAITSDLYLPISYLKKC